MSCPTPWLFSWRGWMVWPVPVNCRYPGNIFRVFTKHRQTERPNRQREHWRQGMADEWDKKMERWGLRNKWERWQCPYMTENVKCCSESTIHKWYLNMLLNWTEWCRVNWVTESSLLMTLSREQQQTTFNHTNKLSPVLPLFPCFFIRQECFFSCLDYNFSHFDSRVRIITIYG